MLSMNPKQLAMGLVRSAKTAVYTVPATNKETVIKDLIIYNTDPSNTVTVKMYIGDYMYINQTIAPNDTLFADHPWTTVVNPGQAVSFEASADNVVQVIMSGIETVDVKTD